VLDSIRVCFKVFTSILHVTNFHTVGNDHLFQRHFLLLLEFQVTHFVKTKFDSFDPILKQNFMLYFVAHDWLEVQIRFSMRTQKGAEKLCHIQLLVILQLTTTPKYHCSDG